MFRIALAAAAAVLIAAAPPAKADCMDVEALLNAARNLADLACETDPEEGWLADSCAAYDTFSESEIPLTSRELWNLLAGNGSATIGPRSLRPEVREQGRLVEPGSRVFVFERPVSEDFRLRVNYLDGKAGLEADVCTVNAADERELVARVNIPRLGNRGFREDIEIDETAMVVVKLKPVGRLGNSYQYTIRYRPCIDRVRQAGQIDAANARRDTGRLLRTEANLACPDRP